MYIIILITASNRKEARKIANQLVKNRLAACVNIVGKLESVFRWKGKIDKAKEELLIIKTKKARLPELIKLVKSIHSYEVPEIIALPIIGGSRPYLRWIDECIG